MNKPLVTYIIGIAKVTYIIGIAKVTYIIGIAKSNYPGMCVNN